ncbi:M15 family metallopeptidase [Paenibacillus sabuli]|uniref:M15 family metallopeptidase n=1 Tax=Paenibacillus sabuli TaxID=2772509 RepID=UPI00295BB87A|nr:M15 family metallopeptidase [Paenibacillus sabuli]
MLLALLGALAYYTHLESPAWERHVPLIEPAEPRIAAGLHPELADKRDTLVRLADQAGIDVLITDAFRSHEEQEAIYAQGRTSPGNIVTRARGGESYHNYGLAIDFALRTSSGEVLWDLEYDGNGNGASDWMEVVEMAKTLGFAWGGDWERFPDYPHLQMDFGYTLDQLQRGFLPPGHVTVIQE